MIVKQLIYPEERSVEKNRIKLNVFVYETEAHLNQSSYV